MTCRITSFEELIEILCAAKLIGDYKISDGLMGYVNRKEYPGYICKLSYDEYNNQKPYIGKMIAVGKLSMIGQILKKDEFIGNL